MSNEELKLFERLLDSKFDTLNYKIDQVLEKTTQTHKWVGEVEVEVIELNKWRAETIGRWKAATFVSGLIAAILGFIGGFIGSK